MPNIRVLNWNIERLSGNKVAIAGMANNIGQVIADSQADIAILLEVTSGTGLAAMGAVSNAANAASVAAGGNPNDYTGWLVSYATGFEYYGVLIRNLNTVRPVRVTAGPTGEDTFANPALSNLDQNQFGTWPGTFAAMVNAYAAPLPAPAARPKLPLIDVYASDPPRGRKRSHFAGRNLANGGYALGNGFRMPCLAMFQINGAATHLVAVMACHLGAVRGGANPLARGQIEQYKDTHISQKFQNPPALALPNNAYIVLNGAATAIQELIITGDFNVDFMQQNPPPPVNALRTGNRTALNRLTPTTVAGGSAGPAAAPGAAGPAPPAPIAVPPGGWPDGPVHTTVPNLAQKTAATTQGTILIDYAAGVVPPNLAALRGACFDNFFFGGTQLSLPAIYQVLTAPADACLVIDLPAQIVHGAGGPGALNVSGAWLHHLVTGTKNAANAPNLNPGVWPWGGLTTNDRLIGARFISDHLPTVVQYNLP